jgi:PAS domain S-box-containing protein
MIADLRRLITRFRSLRVQLLVSHLALVLLLAVVMSGAIERFFNLSRSIEHVTDSNLSGLLAAERMREALSDEQTAVTVSLIGHPDLAEQMLGDARQRFRQNLYQSRASAAGPDITELVGQIQRSDELYQDELIGFVQVMKTQGFMAAETQYSGRMHPIEDELTKSIRALTQANQAAIGRATEMARRDADGAFYSSVVISLLAVAIAVFLALRMVALALNPLALLAKQAEVIGAGDLTRQIELNREDEIGALADAFNSMALKLAELRRSEVRRLQRAERMSDAALDSLYDPVIVTDARGRIVHLNSAAEGIFGPAPAAPRIEVERHISDRRIVQAIHRAVQQEVVAADEGDGAQIPIEVSGTRRIFRLRATPMFTDEALVLGSVTVLEDITHLKEVDRLKNEFVGVASHELRTPVTSLLLSVQLLQEGAAGALNAQQAELVGAQRADLERLERLMRELLDITRLEAGTMVPRLVPVTAAELLVTALQATRASAIKQNVDVSIAPNPSPATVMADRSQIGRVLENLISNAVRHSEPESKVTLRAEPAGNDVLFSVEDTGSGIPQEYLAKIFDRFVQVPGATQGGAGLGLSIAQTIVRAHGGELSVESRVGVGSSFRFTLRVAEQEAEV